MKQSNNRSKQTQADLSSHETEAIRFLSPLEIAVFNHYFKTLDFKATAKALSLKPDECKYILKKVFEKLKSFFDAYSKLEVAINTELFSPQFELDEPIDFLGFSTRVKNNLKCAGCYTLKDLFKITEADLKRIRGMGRTSIEEIKAVLKKKGYGHLWR